MEAELYESETCMEANSVWKRIPVEAKSAWKQNLSESELWMEATFLWRRDLYESRFCMKANLYGGDISMEARSVWRQVYVRALQNGTRSSEAQAAFKRQHF